MKDFFLLAYPAIAIIGKDQLMLLDKPNDAGNNNYCNDDTEICTAANGCRFLQTSQHCSIPSQLNAITTYATVKTQTISISWR